MPAQKLKAEDANRLSQSGFLHQLTKTTFFVNIKNTP